MINAFIRSFTWLSSSCNCGGFFRLHFFSDPCISAPYRRPQPPVNFSATIVSIYGVSSERQISNFQADRATRKTQDSPVDLPLYSLDLSMIQDKSMFQYLEVMQWESNVKCCSHEHIKADFPV